MKTLIVGLALAAALLVGTGSAKPLPLNENADVNCDRLVTVVDIAIVVDHFGDVGVEQELCEGSRHYDGECTNFYLSTAVANGEKALWVQLKLQQHCLR